MSKSQFEKRREKGPEAVIEQITKKRAELRDEAAPVYTQTGYDVFTPNGGKSYHVAEISYNPETNEAKVLEVFNISRLVALSYFNQKTALGTLKRKAVKS